MQIERYELIEEVGHGGMSTVWRGLDKQLGREVAVKVLHPHLASEEEARQRFQREAKAVAKLHHPNILQIYDYSGLDSPSSYIVTEFIRGRTLKQFLSDQRIEIPEIAAAIVAEVGRALSHAHSLGIIHRDLKPENVMIREDGVLKLMDFGIAQILDVQRMTVTGELIGSPAYMAPEQVDGRPLDFRTDVFTLGTLLYQLATGELPFRGRNPHEVLKRISECQYLAPTLTSPRVDDRLASIIKRAMSRDPSERFPTATAMIAELESYLADVGLGEGRECLAKYFADPETFTMELRKQIVGALVQNGCELLGRRDTTQALASFNRALCRDPKNAEILGTLDGMSRRRRRGNTITAGLVLAGIVGTAVAAARYWPTAAPIRPEPTAPVKTSVTRRQAIPLPIIEEAKTPLKPLPEAPPRSASPAVRQIEIVPQPKAVRMKLDGRDLGWYGPDNATVRVGPGPHVLLLENDLCEPKRVSITSAERRDRLPIRLTWKPARVVVMSNVPDAEVTVAGKIGRPGKQIDVPLPPGPSPEANVPLVVRAPGYELHTSRVAVRAGQTMPPVAVELRSVASP